MVAQWNHRPEFDRGNRSPASSRFRCLRHVRKVIRWHRPIEVRGAINHQGLPTLLKHLFLQHGDGSGLNGYAVSWSGITAKDANSRIGR